MIGGNTGTPIPTNKSYQLINTPKKAKWLFSNLRSASRVAVDIETNHPTIRDKDKVRALGEDIVVVGVSFSWKKDSAAYIPLYTGFGTESFWKEKNGLTYVLKELEAFLESETPKTLQNGKFDLRWFYETMGIVVHGFDFDTMLAHHLLDEDGADCGHGLKDMAAHFIDPKAKQYEESLQKALDYYDPTWRRYSRVPIDILYPYACADADFTLQLQDFFEPKLKEENLRWLFDNMTMPLQKTCMYAEIKGFTIDMKKVDELAAYYDLEEKRLTAAVYAASGREFDIKSPQQLADVLYKELGLPQQHLKSGALTTNKEAMFALQGKHPIMIPLSEIRSISKMKDTYVEGVRKRLNHKTGKLHPNFKVHGTITGRLASEDPNVQNLPTVAKGGEKIKSQYVAPDGHKWILSDYRQIELVIATHLSQEPAWLSAFANDEDLHSKTAKAVFGLACPVEDVKKLHEPVRTQAKQINFGILYGQGAHGLSGKLHIPLEEAEEMIRKYFAGLPVLKKWLDGVTAFAMEHGYVVNPFGRRRRVPRVKQWIPPRQNKPKGAPTCFGRKNGPPQFFKGALRQLDLKSNYPLNAGMLQAEAAKLHWSNPCATCPHISTCVSNQEGNRREFEIAGLLREVGNFMIQSTATADLSGMAFSKCVIEARRHGIPLAIQDDVRGMVPVNIVHDELIFQVADEYVPGMTQLMHDVMTTVWPACTVKLETDTDVVQCWGDKHRKGGKLTDDDVRAQILAAGLEEYFWEETDILKILRSAQNEFLA